MPHALYSISLPLTGVLLYLGLCVFSTLTGHAVVRLLAPRRDTDAEWFLSAPLGLAFWTLTLAVTAALKAPIRLASPWIWFCSGIVAVYGLYRRGWSAHWPHVGSFLLCLCLPVVCMGERFAGGLTESSAPVALDGWFYMASGAAAFENGRHVYHGSDPIGRFGSYTRGHRFVASTCLAWLAALERRHDTCRLGGLFQAWTLFVLACAVRFFWSTQKLPLWMQNGATALTVVSSWMATVVWGNWFDHELALVYMPTIAATAATSCIPDWRKSVALGGLAAALLYTFPEGAAAIAIGVFVLLAGSLRRMRCESRRWLLCGSGALLVCAALVLPAAATLAVFLRSQSERVLMGHHFGDELFGGMYRLRDYPGAFWALGGETRVNARTWASNRGGLLITILAALGLFGCCRQRLTAVAAAALLVGTAAVVWLCAFQNVYVALKLLTIYWWVLAGTIVIGIGVVADFVKKRPGRVILASGLFGTVLALNLSVLYGRRPIDNSPYASTPLRLFRELGRLTRIVGRQPVLIDVEDGRANLLAVYYLRAEDVHFARARSWFAYTGLRHYVEATQPPLGRKSCFVLRDRASSQNRHEDYLVGEPVWSNDLYELRRLPELSDSQVALVSAERERGLGASSGQSLLLTSKETTMYVVAPRAGVLRVRGTLQVGAATGTGAQASLTIINEGCSQTLDGPGWAPRRTRGLTPTLEYRLESTVHAGPGSVDIPLRPGGNRLFLACNSGAKPLPPGQHHPEPVLRVLDAHLSFRPQTSVVRGFAPGQCPSKR